MCHIGHARGFREETSPQKGRNQPGGRQHLCLQNCNTKQRNLKGRQAKCFGGFKKRGRCLELLRPPEPCPGSQLFSDHPGHLDLGVALFPTKLTVSERSPLSQGSQLTPQILHNWSITLPPSGVPGPHALGPKRTSLTCRRVGRHPCRKG